MNRREAQARQTRLDVLDAATRAFIENGYAATTVRAVATSAGVSVETVYKLFGNKPALLKAVYDFSMAGDDEPQALNDRAEAAAMRAETDLRRKLQLYTTSTASHYLRSAPIQLLVRAGAEAGSTEVIAVWEAIRNERLNGMTIVARHLLGGGGLRPGLEIGELRDILWTYTSVELFDLLVLQRQWPPDRYAGFILTGLLATLLPSSTDER